MPTPKKLPDSLVAQVAQMVARAGEQFTGWDWLQDFRCSCGGPDLVTFRPVRAEDLLGDHEEWCALQLSARTSAYAHSVEADAALCREMAADAVADIRAGDVDSARLKLSAAESAERHGGESPAYGPVSQLLEAYAQRRAAEFAQVTKWGPPAVTKLLGWHEYSEEWRLMQDYADEDHEVVFLEGTVPVGQGVTIDEFGFARAVEPETTEFLSQIKALFG